MRLVGTRFEEKAVAEVAREGAAEVDFFSDLHAAADYRRHLAAVLAARALRAACDQAKHQPRKHTEGFRG
jgi:CO/xanthine dehydrogenase FAD-binding subunit